MMPTKDKINNLYPSCAGGRFFNPDQAQSSYNFMSKISCLLKSFFNEMNIFFRSFSKWKQRVPKDRNAWIEKDKTIIQSSIEPAITWIGHATFLIQINNINILTDPIFGNATPLFPRIFEPSISFEKLPKIDYVLISHNHLDHMDSKTLLKLYKSFPNIKFLVPVGDKKWFDKRGLSANAYEFNWWEIYNSENIKFTFLPAYHWSQRGIFDKNKSLWGSWMIQDNNRSIYFAGDTGYSKHFLNIAKEFPKIDLALMPIGPCEPREKMCKSHISSEEAGEAFLELGANHFIPMHWGTFYFGTDCFETPINRINNWWNQNAQNLKFKNLNIVKFGQRVYPTRNEFDKVISAQQDLQY